MSKNTLTPQMVSDAIRKNGLPQITGQLVKYEHKIGKKIPVGACAVGQAWINLPSYDVNEVQEALDSIKEVSCPYPKCAFNYDKFLLTSIIMDLNDFHEWTFEQIADFIDEKIKEKAVES